MEEFRAHGFGMRVQGPGSQQGLSFGRSGHGRPYNTAETVCQELNAHMGATANPGAQAKLICIAILRASQGLLTPRVRTMVDICAFIS